ncbi:hypothetical protein [Spirochaeta cellobiosiphila]|uniref:hypothetical protein n=1 Tax=Spirochaeta cellobiosiphila TaxID=504483 RepID=UPI00048D0DF1|nr:hypothetical protein [Spirochaeta cellobiosiphila]
MEKKSTFITVISWFYIVAASLGTITNLLQLILALSFTNNEAMNLPGGMPSFRFLNYNINFLSALKLCLVYIYSSV